jgi:hypothetical protein
MLPDRSIYGGEQGQAGLRLRTFNGNVYLRKEVTADCRSAFPRWCVARHDVAGAAGDRAVLRQAPKRVPAGRVGCWAYR